MSEEKVLTVKELATKLRVSRWTIDEQIRQGRLPAHKIGNQIRLDPKEIDEWWEKNKKA